MCIVYIYIQCIYIYDMPSNKPVNPLSSSQGRPAPLDLSAGVAVRPQCPGGALEGKHGPNMVGSSNRP